MRIIPAYEIVQEGLRYFTVSDKYKHLSRDKKLLMIKMMEQWVEYQKRILGLYDQEEYYMEKFQIGRRDNNLGRGKVPRARCKKDQGSVCTEQLEQS